MNKRALALAATAAVVVGAGAAAAATSSTGGAASDYTSMASTRLVDTRTAGGAVGAGKTLVVPLGKSVPATATAVTINLTVTGSTSAGYLVAYADGGPLPVPASNVNYGKGQTVANQATIPVTDGKIDVFNDSPGSAQIVIDLEGYYTPSAPAYTPPASTTWSLPAAGFTGSGTACVGLANCVTTGGSAATTATEIGTVTLQPGGYLVSFTAKATPLMTSSVQVFPEFFVYDQPLTSSFTGNVLNVGSGALESGGNTNIDSYFSGSGAVTVTAPNTTLYLYAFGYDSDRGNGSYTLDTASLTAVPIS
jgi:hypothetical protein